MDAHPTLPGLTRRHFLLLSSATAMLLAVRPGLAADAAGRVDVDRFMRMSSVLTDIDAALDETVGRIYLQAVLARPGGQERLNTLWQRGGFGSATAPASMAELRARGVFADPALAELADTLATSWYSGVYADADGQRRVAAHTDALAWRTLGYRDSGPGSCGGAFGHWAVVPEP